MPFLAIPLFAGITVGMVAQAAIVIYGVYRGQQQKKAKKQAKVTAEDQKTGVPSSAMIRTINYGRTIVNGRTAFMVAASDAQTHFFIVKALTPDHEIERFEYIYFDGALVDHLVGDLYSEAGATAGPGSRYFRSIPHSTFKQGITSAGGVIACDGPIAQITGLTLFPSASTAPPNANLRPGAFPTGGDIDLSQDFGQWWQSPEGPVHLTTAPIEGSNIVLGPEHANKAYQLTYVWTEGKSHVRLWARKGAVHQPVIQRISEVAPQWNPACQLSGTPYIAAEIDPDLDMFPDGTAPDITAMILGRRMEDIRESTGTKYFSNNAAFCLIDYIRTEMGLAKSEIDLALATAAINACHEQVPYDTAGQTEPRYRCDIELSTDADPIENMQQILACMAGSVTYAGATVDIRAGVPQTPTGELTDNDLASGKWSCRPFTPYLQLFNSVKGLYTQLQAADLVSTDVPIYESATYMAQDSGVRQYETFDLPGVQSVHQAQRIQRLHLHLARNALVFRGQFKALARQFSVGQVIYYSHTSLGMAAKPFQITRRKTLDATVELEMVEMPAAAYAWNYNEATAPDPAPNTNLPNPLVVGAIENLKAESGPSVAKYGPNGEVKPVMKISWDVVRDINVLVGGKIELQWKTSGSLSEDWRKRFLPGTAYKEDVEILRNQGVHIDARAVNALGIPGPWSTIGHFADGVPGGLLTGQLLINAKFAGPPIDSGGAITNWTPVRFGASNVPSLLVRQVYQVPGLAQVAFHESRNDFPGMQWQLESDPIFVYPGQRIVQYVWASCGGGVKVWSMLYFDTTSSQGYTGHSGYRESDAAMPSEAALQPLSGFAVVPAGTKSAKLVIAGILPFDQPASAQRVYLARPYVGPAAESQITLPAWHP